MSDELKNYKAKLDDLKEELDEFKEYCPFLHPVIIQPEKTKEKNCRMATEAAKKIVDTTTDLNYIHENKGIENEINEEFNDSLPK
ncbi:MAG: hypothetical protein ABEK36_03410, partial [Candidatus Aenigmatarchaeota archaeon]